MICCTPLKSLGFVIAIAVSFPGTSLLASTATAQETASSRPNVVVIMTDDQGVGDFGCMGNPLVQTPHIDQMFEHSVRFANFYVCPVCSPTRASLMTGRYHYRTRVVDTWIGRSMMEPDEVTIAERFAQSNYATGIFGKWHLGDNYPMRPMDQGFQRSVVHRGGGIGQSSDPPGGEGQYTDPILLEDGVEVQQSGYCTDVYYDHAIDFIQDCQRQDKPFFVYLADNCPHGPFDDVPEDWWKTYQGMDLSPAAYPEVAGGQPIPGTTNQDKNRRVFAMISNIDQNIGRLQRTLRELNLEDNTIVVFLTDNGPNGKRFTGGLRGQKTSVYEGGIRTLFLFQWPRHIDSKRTLPQLAAHIDLAPTLIDACGLAPVPEAPKMDGVSLLPLIMGEQLNWEQRRTPLVFQVHRGNEPQRYHHFAYRKGPWKLVHHSGFGRETFEGQPQFELFQLDQDPFEKHNLADSKPDLLRQLIREYDAWFTDVSSTRPDNFQPPRIIVAPQTENPLVLTRQDARRNSGTDRADGPTTDHWRLVSDQDRSATAIARFQQPTTGVVVLKIGDRTVEQPIENATRISIDVDLPQGDIDLVGYARLDDAGVRAVHQIELKW